jgi:tRNA(Arg) A34 adenosine deaminase TadA
MKQEKNPSSKVLLTLPAWLEKILQKKNLILPSAEERMHWVIGLSRQNVENKSGGPFAAAIFEINSGKLLAATVNRVEALNCSSAHAEILAFTFAQQRRQSWDLGNDPDNPCELLSSAQPCLMCLGAILWSGVIRLTYGASAADVTAILGFDEGPLPVNWQKELQTRGINVVPELYRQAAVTVLELYKKEHGTIYNSRR